MSSQRISSRVGPLQIIITALTVITGLIHLYLGLPIGSRMGHPRRSLPGGQPPMQPPPAYSGGGWSASPPPASAGGQSPVGAPPLPAGGHSTMMALPLPLPELFLLNFVGYIVLAAVYFLPILFQFQPLLRYQRVIRWLLIIYTAVTVILWFVITQGHYNPFAYADKPIEVALIILLLIDDWKASRPRAQQA
jgi:hypothetical protein